MKWLVLLLLIPVFAHPQPAPSLLPGEGGGHIIRTESYQGRSLSGYMNGGAELFHEYGFLALSVQVVVVDSAGEITVEIFRMSSSRAAFGIYSVSRHGCAGADSAGVAVCEGAYQVQGTAGENYIRIQSGTDTPAARKARRALFSVLVRRLGQEHVAVSPYFRHRKDVLVMNGPLGVQNGMPELEEVLDGVEGYAIEAAWLDPMGAGYDLVAGISFPSDASAATFSGQPGVVPEGRGTAELPGHQGWWALRVPGNVVWIMKGSVDREHAADVLKAAVPGR
jgi:hypothetical protein